MVALIYDAPHHNMALEIGARGRKRNEVEFGRGMIMPVILIVCNQTLFSYMLKALIFRIVESLFDSSLG